LLNLIKQRNILGGSRSWICVLEPSDNKKCDKCGEPFKVGDWVRIEHIWDFETNHIRWTQRIFCFKCSERYNKSGRLAQIIQIREEDKNEN